MSNAAFSRRVDELIASGMTMDKAISQAGNESAHFVDGFTRMKREALDSLPVTV
jgi:hypothetical protein